MRKSPRLLAGIVVLGLFAFVGTLTAGAFTSNRSNVNAPEGATAVRSALDNQWDETRKGSVTKP